MKLAASSIATAVVIAATWVGASPAEASHVECGDEITADTTLDSDLINCPNNGLVIGADDITVDLDGHLLDGDDAVFPACEKDEICDMGILLEGHDSVTVKGGTARGFDLGAFVLGGSDATLARVKTVHNTFSGMVVAESDDTILRHDLFRENGLETDEAGISVFETSHLRIAESDIIDNGDIGLYGEGNTATEIVRNNLAGNPEAGSLMDGARMRFARNRVSRNGDGLGIAGDHNTIKRNVVNHSAVCGNFCGNALSVEAGSGNRIIGNRVEDADEVGIRVAGYGRVKHALVARNTVRGAGKDAYQVRSVRARVTDVVVRRNQAAGARDDGIDVSVDSVRIGDNEANRNGGLGIEAEDGVTDTGGNRAAGNGGAAQCLNVHCT